MLDTALKESGDSDEFLEIKDYARQVGLTIQPVDRPRLSSILGDINHQGVALRTGPYPYVDLDDILSAVRDDPASTVVILDHIEDPQNVGSILRTADAAGVCGVIIPEDRAACVSPAAVRASAGASEHMNVAKVVNLVRAIEKLKEAECWITALDFGDDARNYTDIDFTGRCAIVIGNEGSGVGRLVRENSDFVAMLPMMGEVSSLNAGVAGGIALYEVLRQKGVKAGC